MGRSLRIGPCTKYCVFTNVYSRYFSGTFCQLSAFNILLTRACISFKIGPCTKLCFIDYVFHRQYSPVACRFTTFQKTSTSTYIRTQEIFEKTICTYRLLKLFCQLILAKMRKNIIVECIRIKHKTFVKQLYNAGPTSSIFDLTLYKCYVLCLLGRCQY